MAAQAGLCLAWSETPEDTFSHGVAHLQRKYINNIKVIRPDEETETPMVCHLKSFWHGKENSAGGSERRKKERKTEEEMGR